MSDPKMTSSLNQLPDFQNNNIPISSTKLDGPKTYLVRSRQCIVSLKARRLMGYVTGDKKNNQNLMIQRLNNGANKTHSLCHYCSILWTQHWWHPTSYTKLLRKFGRPLNKLIPSLTTMQKSSMF